MVKKISTQDITCSGERWTANPFIRCR